MNIKFPLTHTGTGDLALAQTPAEDAKSRAHLLSVVTPGERPIVPNFGRPVHVFDPAMGAELQAAQLADALNLDATQESDITYSVQVGDVSQDRRPMLDIYWQTRTDRGAFRIG